MIKRKIKSTGQNNFYLMPLNKETAEYVLKISAVKELFENHTNLEDVISKPIIKLHDKLKVETKKIGTIREKFNSINIHHHD